MLRLLKSTGTTNVYDQILKILYNLDASLARDFGEIPEDMSLTDFMSKMDLHFENWKRQVDQKRMFTDNRRRPQDQRRGSQTQTQWPQSHHYASLSYSPLP